LYQHRSENDLCDSAKKRKISVDTPNKHRRRTREIFASLKKTYRKQGLSFREYLEAKLAEKNLITPLPELICSSAARA
ncbi:MAG: transposase, partial [Candidatus Competibacteraceae bacterium]|jgi:hypothetical protein|nr:transposase [Candidatus Competibacteraceae bacterium]